MITENHVVQWVSSALQHRNFDNGRVERVIKDSAGRLTAFIVGGPWRKLFGESAEDLSKRLRFEHIKFSRSQLAA
jgi:hypothetical protein